MIHFWERLTIPNYEWVSNEMERVPLSSSWHLIASLFCQEHGCAKKGKIVVLRCELVKAKYTWNREAGDLKYLYWRPYTIWSTVLNGGNERVFPTKNKTSGQSD